MPIPLLSPVLRLAQVILVLLFIPVSAFSQSATYEQAFSAYQTQKFAEAESLWTELANGGDVNAQYALGVMHLRQEASDASPAAAFSWFEKASDQGHATAMFNLGVAYWEGAGVTQDKSKALSLWQNAALKGDSGAQFNLGLAYYIGEERSPDLEQAAKWIGLAADQNHPEATRILAAIESEQANGSNANVSKDSQGSDTPASSENKPEESTELSETALSLNKYWKTVDQVTLLFDSPNGTSFRELSPGTPLEIMGQDGGWAQITLPQGLRTWIYSKFIEIEGAKGVISGDAVRIRPNPSTDSAISPPLGKYQRGEQVTVLSSNEEWVEIRAPKQIGAWLKVESIIEYQDTSENRASQWKQAVANGM